MRDETSWEERKMQTSAKQRLLRLAAGSMFAAGTVLIPTAVASAEPEGGAGASIPSLPNKGPHPLPDEIPTDPAEGLPVPTPGEDA